MTGADVERVRLSGSPLLTTVERDALFCMPSLLRSSVRGHFAPAQIHLPRTDRVSGCRNVATPALVETPPYPPNIQGEEEEVSCSLYQSRSVIHLSVLFTTERPAIIFGLVMDGWQALFQRSNRPLVIAWQPGVAGLCHAACWQRTHGSKFQPHTAAGYQNAKPDRSSFRASLGSV